MCRTHYLEAIGGADLEFYRPRLAAKEMPESKDEDSEEDELVKESAEDSSEEEDDVGSTWACHLCGEEQSIEKKRCGHCRAWQGGTRDLEKSPEKKEKKGSTPERRLNEKCIVTGCEKWGQGFREGYMCRRHFRENNSKESKPKKKKKKAAAKAKVKTKPKASDTRGRLCSVSGCPKFRQSGHNGMCRKHYLASSQSKPKSKSKQKSKAYVRGASSAKESTCASSPTNDQPPAQIVVTATGETVTTMKVPSMASSSSPPAAMKSLDAKMVAAVDSDWKRSLQQLVSYQRKHGCDPAQGSKAQKWLAKQALEYARRQKKSPSELTKGHAILLEQKAGFVYGGKIDKRKLDEMKAGGSGAPVGLSSSSASKSSTGSNDRPKKKARRRS